MSTSPLVRRARAAVATLALTAFLPAATAFAQGPFPSELTLTPESDTAPAGTCNEFTARVTEFGEPEPDPVAGVTVDVLQTLASADVEPAETRELAFCDPQGGSGPNPTGQGGTSFGDVSGNNPGESAGDAGRNTTVRGEVGPTNVNGEVTFGITMTPQTAAGSVSVRAWYDGDDDEQEAVEGEPGDSSTKTWTAVEPPAMTLDASPESSSNPNGSQHTVSVTVLSGGNPAAGVVPYSVIDPDGSARPPGDAANPAAGASPNYTPGNGPVYSCTASNGQGVATCTYQDQPATGAGTDTIVFFADLGGQAGAPDQNEPQDAVQKTWFVPSNQPPTQGPPNARNLRLCHGPSPVPLCDTSAQTEDVENDHTVSILVTDREGEALPGIPVELRHAGPARFVANGAHTLFVTTGADGIATAVLSSPVEGTSSVVAEISPPGSDGSFRGPGPADDDCEQPAGPGGDPPAGNCVSANLTILWESVHEVLQCDDGVDNDDDGFVDMEDPGCVHPQDDSELPVNFVEPIPHDRHLNMRFRDWVGPGDEGLVIFGRLRVPDGFRRCGQGQPVVIQRRVDGKWVTKKHATTNARGRYAGVVFDVLADYRAVAPATEVEHDGRHLCRKEQIVKPHHHRRS